MFASQKLNRGLAPLALAVVVACAFSACKKDAEGEAAPAAAAQQAAPAPTVGDPGRPHQQHLAGNFLSGLGQCAGQPDVQR